MLRSASVAAVLVRGACVAPEQPEPARVVQPVQPNAASAAAYETAPTPNNRMRRPGNDEIIRMAH